MRMHKASVQLAVEVESSSRDAAEYLANRVIEATKKISITKHFSEGHGAAAEDLQAYFQDEYTFIDKMITKRNEFRATLAG